MLLSTVNFVIRTITEWRRRNRSRRELANLPFIELSDIACTESDARAEAGKWFWQS